jgi:hypothetical protein
MGKRKRQKDAVFKTHKKFFVSMSSSFDCLIFENVTEYPCSLLKKLLPKHWSVQTSTMDARSLGFGAARARLYAVAWDSTKLSWEESVPDMRTLLEMLVRAPSLRAADYFWRRLPSASLTSAQEDLLTLTPEFQKLIDN